MVLLGLTVTGAAFDMFMSLDPHWYSTMFGVYFFAGSAVSFFGVIILIAFLLQRGGFLARSIDTEHYHDLGKFLFGFVFFWGYIAFSQYMLLWYANIPEETEWFARHGATTVKNVITGDAPFHYAVSGWSAVVLAILFGQLLIPFARAPIAAREAADGDAGFLGGVDHRISLSGHVLADHAAVCGGRPGVSCFADRFHRVHRPWRRVYRGDGANGRDAQPSADGRPATVGSAGV